MKVLIIYDNNGELISIRQGEPLPKEPVGVPFLWTEIPVGKQLKLTDGVCIDVTKTPHEPIFEDIPKTEFELLKERATAQEKAIAELTTLVAMTMV
ncbi:MAG: hypothetical protein ACI33M_03235 [Lysinibacillus sp.]